MPVALLLALAGPGNVFADIAGFFSRMAVVTFGGAYAVLAYVAQEAVGTFGWLAPGEMLDGLGMAETTPGPLIMVLQFVGFLAAYREAGWELALLAGTLGGLLATWVTFAPCFAWIFLGAPFIEDLRGNRALSAALTAVTAAVAGVVLNLAVWFAINTVFAATTRIETGPLSLELPRPRQHRAGSRPPSPLLALLAVFRWKLGLPAVLAGGAALGSPSGARPHLRPHLLGSNTTRDDPRLAPARQNGKPVSSHFPAAFQPRKNRAAAATCPRFAAPLADPPPPPYSAA